MPRGTILKDVPEPPGYHHHCPLCGSSLHFIGWWHCYECGTDWEVEDIAELEYDALRCRQ